MDAVILAAGLGTRLRPHTLTTPKPLLQVQGRPILDWTLSALPSEVNRVIVVVHYLSEQIEAYLAQQSHFPDYTVVPQGDPQGTGDAFRKCQSHIRSERILVQNGDDLYGAEDLRNLLSKPAGFLCHPVDQPRKFGIAFPNEDSTLKELIEKPDLDGTQLANTGAYLFPREVFDIELHKSPRGEYEITEYVSTLASQQPFHVVPATFWFPIGTEEAWNEAQQLDLKRKMTKA